MKRLLSIVFLLTLAFATMAQDCYNSTRQKGISLYNKKQYSKAKTTFAAAKTCPDKPNGDDLESWIRKCNNALSDENTSIFINGNITSSVQFDEGSVYRSYAVSTKASSWSVSHSPSWCSVTKSSNQITLQISQNTSGHERSDYVEVRTSGGKTARLNISQNVKPSYSVTAIRTSFEDDEDLKIYFDYTINNLDGKELYFIIGFYGEDGEPIKTTSDSDYGIETSNGDYIVATGTKVTTRGNNFKSTDVITIPYSELHQTGRLSRPLQVIFLLLDDDGEFVDNEGSVSFTFEYIPRNNQHLTVDGTTGTHSVRFGYNGGYANYDVSSPTNSYQTWGVPNWCSVSNKTSTSFKLTCNENTSTSSRSDYMEVRANGEAIRININQDGKQTAEPTFTINSVRQEHNVYVDGVKGLKIHIDCNVLNMKGKKSDINIYFQDAENNDLVDLNGKYCTNGSPAKVAISTSITPSYDNSHWEDLELFIPHSELHQTGTGTRTIKFQIWAWDRSVSPAVAYYKGGIDYAFTYTP